MQKKPTLTATLDLILKLADGQPHTARELADETGTTTRNVYYTLHDLEDYGFLISHDKRHYVLDRHSPFLSAIAMAVDTTDDQAHSLSERLAIVSHRRVLAQAMRRKLTVSLHGYASPHSDTVSDREVEPFMFLGGGRDIRAFEPASGMNKTFSLSRVMRVELLDRPWQHEERHREVFTDLFLFSGEERHHVKLCLDLLAHNLMVEEYPRSAMAMTQLDGSHWIFEGDVASYKGIGRFILGLYPNITVLADDGLRQYLQAQIRRMEADL